jgi:hypothetical protein
MALRGSTECKIKYCFWIPEIAAQPEQCTGHNHEKLITPYHGLDFPELKVYVSIDNKLVHR